MMIKHMMTFDRNLEIPCIIVVTGYQSNHTAGYNSYRYPMYTIHCKAYSRNFSNRHSNSNLVINANQNRLRFTALLAEHYS